MWQRTQLRVGHVLVVDRAREQEQMVEPLRADVRRKVARDELVGHVSFIGDAAAEHLAENRRGAEDPARRPEREAGRVALDRGHVASGDFIERDRVDEQQSLDALGPARRQAQRDGTAKVETDDCRFGETHRREGTIHELRLRRDPEVGVEGTVRLAVAEEIDRERRAIGEGDLGGDVAPDEARRPEAMQQDDGRAAVAVPLDVNRARPDRDAQQIGVDGTLLLVQG